MNKTKFKTHSQVLKEQLKDPKFKRVYGELGPEYELIRALIEARLRNKYSQAELAKKAGMQQSAIARIESGAVSPTLQTFTKIANAIGKEIVLS